MKKLALALMLVFTASILIVSCAKKEEPTPGPGHDSTNTLQKHDSTHTTMPADSTMK